MSREIFKNLPKFSGKDRFPKNLTTKDSGGAESKSIASVRGRFLDKGTILEKPIRYLPPIHWVQAGASKGPTLPPSQRGNSRK